MEECGERRGRALGVVMVVLGVVAVVCAGVWGWSFVGGTDLPTFMESGKRVGLGEGFLYVGVAGRSDVAVLKRMAAMAAAAGGHVPEEELYTSTSGGDRMIFWGWARNTHVRVQGGMRGVVAERTVWWISPWAGIIPGVAVWVGVLGRRWWRSLAGRRVAGFEVLPAGEEGERG
ncbi:MAG TPA: hypothetical protein VHQ47_01835 [Phycisphaerae bacterium]|nr:hypothetical protein [Phycisphaerae bacterium]